MSNITKGAAIQPRIGGRLNDARAESDPFLGQTPGDALLGIEPRLLIRWSHQASPNDRHYCTGPADCFVLA